MSVRSTQSITVEFTTRVFSTGVGTNADSLPTGTLVVNGTDNAASVTITNVDTGRYKAAVTLPTLALNDVVELVITAIVSTITDKSVIWRDTKDFFAASVPDVAAGAAGGLLLAGSNAATTFATLTSTGAFTINGTSNIAQTGDSFNRIGALGAGLTSVVCASVTGAVGSVTGSVGSVVGAVGSVAGNVVGSVASVVGAVGSVTGAVGSVTAGVIVTTNNDKTGYALTSAEETLIADAILKRDLSAVSGEASRSVINALRKLINKWSIAGSILTVTKEDDVTPAYTQTIGTTPGADPITSLDTV